MLNTTRNDRHADFRKFGFNAGLLADLGDDEFPSRLASWDDCHETLPGNATHFGYVFSGTLSVHCSHGDITLCQGMYFSLPGAFSYTASGKGIVVSRYHYQGFFTIGGPSESCGRLRYIDGCTDSLLVSPVTCGDPCLNLLHFPPMIDQTAHTHPSLRAGIVVRGGGHCRTEHSSVPLHTGDIFIIPSGSVHSFVTGTEPMTVIAYHPDSDFGPTDDFHPMINRTIVGGVSAREIDEIRTRAAQG